jgi:hypothetical protein
MEQKFRITFKEVHDRTGLTAYAVAKQTGLTENTVRKYVYVDEIVTDYIHSAIITLAKFYGLAWDDPAIVEIVEENDLPEINTPLFAQA